MYNSTITQLPFSEKEVGDITHIVQSSCLARDISMLSVIRCLLYDRKPADENFVLYICNNDWTADAQLSIYTCSLPSNLDLSEYEKPEDLHRFVGQVQACKSYEIYINKEKHKTVVYAPCMNYTELHFLNILIPRLLPWYFTEKPLNEREVNLLRSFKDADVLLTQTLMQELFNETELAKTLLELKLKSALKQMNELNLRARKNDVDRSKTKVENLLEEYTDALRMLREAQYKLVGFEAAMKNSSTIEDILQYIKSNDNLIIDRCEDNTITFEVGGYLNQVDSDVFEEYIENTDSFFYNEEYAHNLFFGDLYNRINLMRMLFGADPQGKIRTCGMYQIETNGEAYGRDLARFNSKFHDCIPNPHIFYYHCLGNYKRLIVEALMNYDIIGAIDQCIASVSSLNICEECTMEKLMNDLFTTDKRCIELNTGEVVTPEEAVKKIYG